MAFESLVKQNKIDKRNRQESITKIRGEINEIEMKKQYKKSMKLSWFFGKFDKTLVELIKRKRIQINKIKRLKLRHYNSYQ